MNGAVEVAHEVKVSLRAGIEGSVLYRATCTCGWEGPQWGMPRPAGDDAENHLSEYAD